MDQPNTVINVIIHAVHVLVQLLVLHVQPQNIVKLIAWPHIANAWIGTMTIPTLISYAYNALISAQLAATLMYAWHATQPPTSGISLPQNANVLISTTIMVWIMLYVSHAVTLVRHALLEINVWLVMRESLGPTTIRLISVAVWWDIMRHQILSNYAQLVTIPAKLALDQL